MKSSQWLISALLHVVITRVTFDVLTRVETLHRAMTYKVVLLYK
jgi:hypothetical protein